MDVLCYNKDKERSGDYETNTMCFLERLFLQLFSADVRIAEGSSKSVGTSTARIAKIRSCKMCRKKCAAVD